MKTITFLFCTLFCLSSTFAMNYEDCSYSNNRTIEVCEGSEEMNEEKNCEKGVVGPIVVVIFDLGRRSRDCKGIGICSIVIRGGGNPTSYPQGNSTSIASQVSSGYFSTSPRKSPSSVQVSPRHFSTSSVQVTPRTLSGSARGTIKRTANGKISLEIDKSSMDAQTYATYFKNGTFRMEESFNLPRKVLNNLGMNSYTIKRGSYRISGNQPTSTVYNRQQKTTTNNKLSVVL